MNPNAYHNALLERAMDERLALERLSGAQHEQVVERFRELDKASLVHNRHELAHTHYERTPQMSGAGQMGVLLHEKGEEEPPYAAAHAHGAGRQRDSGAQAGVHDEPDVGAEVPSVGEHRLRPRRRGPRAAGPLHLRDRSGLDGPARDIEHVPAPEIAAAAQTIVEVSFGIENEELIEEVGRQLGFRRIGTVIDAMTDRERLVRDDGHLTVPE